MSPTALRPEEPGTRPLRIAVIGAGVAGLVAASVLGERHEVDVYEAEQRPGGHVRTVTVEDRDGVHAVDLGFIVYNERNYPAFTRLLRALGIASRDSDMSFAVSREEGRREWAGDGLLSFFNYGKQFANPSQWSLLAEILRFNRRLGRLVRQGPGFEGAPSSLGAFLDEHRFSSELRYGYLLPMASAIWSVPMSEVFDFPTVAFARFFHNHGLLGLGGRPLWRTVEGGAFRYVEALRSVTHAHFRVGEAVRAVRPGAADGLWRVHTTDGDAKTYDRVVLACHADQAAVLLPDASPARAWLTGFRFQPNRLVFHRDPGLLPRSPRLWSSWNYFVTGREDRPAYVSYWMNRLQRLSTDTPYVVSLNPAREPARGTVLAELAFDHPVFDRPSEEARARLPYHQGRDGLYYCGAWLGYGFHEDGVRSALAVAARFGLRPSWAPDEP